MTSRTLPAPLSLCLAAALATALTAVVAPAAPAAPALPGDTPVSADGRVGGTPVPAAHPPSAGFTGTGNPADARGVRPVTGAGPRVVAPDEQSTASIIAPDERTRVNPTTVYPARANVYFTYTKPNGATSWCTGWLYAANAVATAGHCVHSGGPSGGWNTAFTVHPGRNGATSPYGSCGTSAVYSVTGWVQDASVEYDYAGLKLDCTIGTTTGWYGMNWAATPTVGTPVTSAGYPQDKPSATQWTTTSAISAVHTRQLAYHLDTTGGQSGSPVHHVGCSTYCADAVHAYGYGDHNRGTRITEAAFANLHNWKL
ncbi:trypsin-like serine peptidase [Saccharothrix yanglingensis]|uniref:Serine protease n=1 Tax=Saccharothrix yanglingensis TaxID=659496 RepID=A0ABU0WT48_9PSEU|nr:trypsin-like peptidase domain-containing protein [Saccharothrix yanglingensis]MDQ2583013.1 serine protease [Saccharothrix yanglingensis]